MKNRRMWILVVMVTAAVAVYGAEPVKTADEVMAFSLAKMDGYATWSADTKQTMGMKGMPLTLTGQIWFKAPRYTRTEMQMPMVGALGKMTVVLGDDKWMWQEMDIMGKKQVVKMNMSAMASNFSARTGQDMNFLQNANPVRSWEASRQWMNYTLLSGEPVDGQPMWVLEGTWKSGAATNAMLAGQAEAFGKLRLSIGMQDGFPHRIESFDRTQGKAVMTMEFTRIQFNPKLDDAMFHYQPPAGVQPMDITEMSRRMFQQDDDAPAPEPKQ